MFLDFQVSDDHTTILKAHDSAEHIPHHELLHILLTEAHNARTVHEFIDIKPGMDKLEVVTIPDQDEVFDTYKIAQEGFEP
jgi:hypothetical protein